MQISAKHEICGAKTSKSKKKAYGRNGEKCRQKESEVGREEEEERKKKGEQKSLVLSARFRRVGASSPLPLSKVPRGFRGYAAVNVLGHVDARWGAWPNHTRSPAASSALRANAVNPPRWVSTDARWGTVAESTAAVGVSGRDPRAWTCARARARWARERSPERRREDCPCVVCVSGREGRR